METESGCFLSLIRCFDSTKFAQWKVRGRIQIRCVRQKRSIKRRSAFSLLSSLLCLTRKHNVSQAKDKERLIRLTFQGCFLISLIISLAFYLYHDYIFFFSYFYTMFVFPILFRLLFHFFPLFFVYNLNRN